jgi:hypothetical protein
MNIFGPDHAGVKTILNSKRLFHDIKLLRYCVGKAMCLVGEKEVASYQLVALKFLDFSRIEVGVKNDQSRFRDH